METTVRQLLESLCESWPGETPDSCQRAGDLLQELNNLARVSSKVLFRLVGRQVSRWENHSTLGSVARAMMEKWQEQIKIEASSEEEVNEQANEQTKDEDENAVSSKKRLPATRNNDEEESGPATKKAKAAPTNNNEACCRVCNVKVEFIRPKYQTLKDWVADSQNVYIGRKGIVFVKDGQGNKYRFPKVDSPWHNPFKVDEKKGVTRAHVVRQFEEHLRKRLDEDPRLKQKLVEELDGKVLGCWCAPQPCHGHVLQRVVQELKQEQQAASRNQQK